MSSDKPRPAGLYTGVSLTAEQIKRGEYMRYLGGGSETWDSRGYFQLLFMQTMGVLPHHRFLDVGCGPGRASRFLIEYLEAGNYFGVDYNSSFISAAQMMVEAKAMAEKKPTLEVVSDFSIPEKFPQFSYGLAFSVLNHCSHLQRCHFFSKVPDKMQAGSKFYMTHAEWYSKTPLVARDWVLTKRIMNLGISPQDYGWLPGESIFPILEFTKTPADVG